MTPAEMAGVHGLAMTHSRPWSADEFAALLGSPLVFSVGDEGAFALGRAIADEVELLTIAVAPDAQRQGRGRRTLAAFEAKAKQRGATRAFLEVSEENLGALALYRSAGWSEGGRRKGYYTSGATAADAILMEKRI